MDLGFFTQDASIKRCMTQILNVSDRRSYTVRFEFVGLTP